MFTHWLRKSFPKVANKKVVRRARTMLPQFVPLEDRVNPVTLFGLTDANQILTFDSATPGTINSAVTITGLQAGELITGIDTRPATGQLYGMGLVDDGATRTARIYTINASTGAATPVGGAPFTTTYPDSPFGGFNFNPNVDLIRVISREGPNFRVSPNTGALVGTDTNTSQTGLNGVSYTNNDGFVPTTTLFGLNFSQDKLVTIGGLNGTPSPNTGQVFTVGATSIVAFDAYAMEIISNNGTASAFATADGKIYSVDLTTGALTNLGVIGGAPTLIGLTAPITTITVGGTAGDDTLVVTTTGANSGSYSLNGGAAVSFSGVTSFSFLGNAGNDTMQFLDSGFPFSPFNGIRFFGGADNDTLIGRQIGTSFDINGLNSGSGSGAIFTDVENLQGGDGVDTFSIATGGSLTGTINGGGGNFDRLNYSAFSTGIAVNLGLGTSGLTSNLNGLQENPPVATAASGTFNVAYDNVTRQATVTGTINNFTNTITDAHIHRAGVGTNGPVIVPIGAAAFVPTGTPGQFTLNVVLTIPAVEEASFLGGQTYFNVHSNVFPGGEIRGQIFSNGNVNLSSGTATGTGGIVGIEEVFGGSGNDSIVGSFLSNFLIGNDGNDVILGGPGSDTFLGGNGNDVFIWSNGDGTDIMEGGDNADTVAVNGSVTAGDVFVVNPNASRLNFQRTSPGPFGLDIGSTETLVVNGLGGSDVMTVFNTTGIADLNRIDLNGFAGNDTFNIVQTNAAIATKINATEDSDSVNIGTSTGFLNPGLLTPVAGPVTVQGNGLTFLFVDDSGASVAADYSISANSVTRSVPAGFGGVTYDKVGALVLTVGAGANIIDVNSTAAGTATSVNTNAGSDTVNVLSTNATGPLTIDTGSELDQVFIGTANVTFAPGKLTPVAGAVTVDGGTEGADITVDGSGASVDADYAITNTTVTRSLPAGFGGVNYLNANSLFLTVGSGKNIIDVLSTAADIPTIVNTNDGEDTVNVLSTAAGSGLFIDAGSGFDFVNIGTTNTTTNPGKLTPVAGAVIVDGSTDGGSLVVDGSGAGVTADYAISASEVTRSIPAGFGGVSYLNFNSLLLTVGAGANIIDVLSTDPATATSIFTNAGNDTIRLANGVSLNGGTIDGGADIDTIDYSQFTTGVSVNLGTNATGGAFTSSLNGLQENPPIVTAGTGTLNVVYDNVTRQATVTGTINNLTNPIVDFHIHRQGVGVNGPVIVGIGAAVFVPTGVAGQFTVNVVLNIPSAHEAAFLGGLTYFNIHTNPGFPGGEIRGQIVPSNVFVAATGTATGTAGIVGIENAIGGSGADSLVGDGNANLLRGNAGADAIVSARGNDTMDGGNDNDDIVWSNGDNNDVIDGGTGSDRVTVNGAIGGGDVFTIGAGAGGRLAFARTNLVPFTLDIGTAETFVVNGYGGDDAMTLNDTTGVANLTRIDLNGLAGNDAFFVAPSPLAVVNVTGHEQTTGDSLSVNGAGLTLTNTANTGVTANAGFYTASGKAQVNFRMIESGVSTLSIDDATVVEGTGSSTNLVFTVRLSAPSSQTVSVNYSLTDGSAVSFEDFANAAGTVTFAPGETVQTITVAINPENVDENDELFAVNLDSPVNATILDGAAVGTIQDDDDAPAISVGDSTITEGTGGTSNIAFTISLSNPSSRTVTVDYVTGNGSAIDFDDYVASNGTVTFAPGETTKVIVITVVSDALDENDEDFSVTLSNPVNGTIADGDAIGLIQDDDLPPIFSISDATIAEGNAGTQSLTFTVSLDAPAGRPITIDFATVAASALAGSDFIAQAGTLTFNPGVTSQTVVVTVNGDVVVEGNEAFAIELSNAINATLLDTVGTGTITNDDSATISIATGAGSVEGVDRVFTLTLTNPVDVPVSVLFATGDVTAVAGATNDYVAIANSLVTFSPGGALSQTVTVTVNDDLRLEGNESFNGTIGSLNPAGRSVTLGTSSTNASITDNETATVAFAKATSSVLEAPTGVTIPVVLTLNTVGSVGTPGLDRSVTAVATRTGGTATVDVDFSMISPITVTFAAGVDGTTWFNTTTVAATIFEDLRTETGNETIVVDLSTTATATTVGSIAQHTLTITDDDALPSRIRTATPGSGSTGTILRTFNPANGQQTASFVPFPGFNGSVTSAQGDLTGDGIVDLVVAAGAGGGPHVKAFDGVTGAEIRSFFAFDPSFTGGVSLAIGDTDNDGMADIITGAGAGGGPHVKVFSGANVSEIRSFFAFDAAFRGGVSVAAGEMTGDNRADIVVAAGPGGGPHVRAFSGADGTSFRSFFAYDVAFSGGVNVAVGDVNGDGIADIITGAGAGGGPHVKAFHGTTNVLLANLFAYDPSFTGGVDVSIVDVTGDGTAEIVTGAGAGGAPHVKLFNLASANPLANFFADDLSFRGGVDVG